MYELDNIKKIQHIAKAHYGGFCLVNEMEKDFIIVLRRIIDIGADLLPSQQHALNYLFGRAARAIRANEIVDIELEG